MIVCLLMLQAILAIEIPTRIILDQTDLEDNRPYYLKEEPKLSLSLEQKIA